MSLPTKYQGLKSRDRRKITRLLARLEAIPKRRYKAERKRLDAIKERIKQFDRSVA